MQHESRQNLLLDWLRAPWGNLNHRWRRSDRQRLAILVFKIASICVCYSSAVIARDGARFPATRPPTLKQADKSPRRVLGREVTVVGLVRSFSVVGGLKTILHD